MLTKTAIIEMLLADRELARSKGQSSAAIRAAELLGKELGMFIDRAEVRSTLEARVAAMTHEERLATKYDLVSDLEGFEEGGEAIEGEVAKD